MSFEALVYVKQLRATTDGRNITSTEKLVLYVLAEIHHFDHHEAFPSIDAMAGYTCLNKRTVQRTIHELVNAGILTAEERPNDIGRQSSNVYQFPAVDGDNRPRELLRRGAAQNRPSKVEGRRSVPRGAALDTARGGRDDNRGAAQNRPNHHVEPPREPPAGTIPSSATPPQAPPDVVGPQAGTPALAFIEAQRTRYREAPQQRIAIIGDVYTHLIGEKPIWARLGAALNKTGATFDEAVSSIQEAVLRNPTDDPMSYVIAVMERKHGTKRRTTTPARTRDRGASEHFGSDAERQEFNRKFSRRLAPGTGDGAEDARVLDGDTGDDGASGAA